MPPQIRKFLSYYKPYKAWLIADLACALLVSVTLLLIPLCVRHITKNLLVDITPHTIRQIYQMGGLMLGLIVLHIAGNTFVDYQGHLMGAKMERDMRNELFAHLQTFSFRLFNEQKTGQLMSRLTHDSFALSELYHHGPEDILISLLNFSGAFAILLAINLQLALLLFLLLPIMIIYAAYFNLKMRRAMRQSKARIGEVNAQIEDSLAGIRVVKSFANEALEYDKFRRVNNQFLQSRQNEYKSETYFHEGIVAFTQLMPLVVVVFGGVAIVQNRLDLPDLLTFLLYVGIFIEPIKRFGNFVRLYQEGMTGFERFMELLAQQPEIADNAQAAALTQVAGKIEFRRVNFTYSKAQTSLVLRNFSLTIEAGEFVALVGASGVGKTTLCALIPRFYEVDGGDILLDGIPINQIALHSLRQHIGMVQQEIYLFAGTVAENIWYGRPQAPYAEMVEAAKQANAHDFIMALPHGYDTDIGQRGIKLSGGQRQRLSIARVFLKNPPILILDEATSALDNESERLVQASLARLMADRTTLVVAHRLTTIRNAQRIIVLTDAGIVEQGSFDELLARNGAFARFYRAQHNLPEVQNHREVEKV